MHQSGSILGVGLALAALVVPRAHAEPPTPLTQLLGDPAEQREVIQAATRAPVVQQNPCPTAHYSVASGIVIDREPSFDAAGKAVAGSWRQSVEEEGCGTRRTLNVIVIAQSSGGYAALPLLPGTTRADPALQRDAFRSVVKAAANTPGAPTAGCPRPYVADTEFVERETRTPVAGREPAWRERWTYVVCTKRLEIPVRFVPGAAGTTVSAGPSTAIKITSLETPAP
jgi:hypothetical protein